MNLVTGVTGHFGKATIDFLLKKGISANNISALVRDETKAEDLKAKGIGLKTPEEYKVKLLEEFPNYASAVLIDIYPPYLFTLK